MGKGAKKAGKPGKKAMPMPGMPMKKGKKCK